MRRRRRNSNDGSGFVFVLAVVGILACVAFFFVIPAAVVIWWFTAEVLGLAQRRLRTLSDVGPTAVEEVERVALDQEIAVREAAMDAARTQGDGAGLRRRSDGMFDERAYLGRDLNLRLQSENRKLTDALMLKADLIGVIDARISRWVRRKALVTGARAGIATFVVATGAMIVTRPAVASSVGGLNFLIGQADDHTRAILGSLAIAGACACAVNYAAYRLKSRELLG